MKPVVYSHDYVPNVSGKKLGTLVDCIECTAETNLFGSYELYIEYPLFGTGSSLLVPNNIVYASHQHDGDAQPYRIYKVTKGIGATISVYARHIIQADLSGVPLHAGAVNAPLSVILELIRDDEIIPGSLDNFSFSTDITSTDPYLVNPQSLLVSALDYVLYGDGSLAKYYGGEPMLDGFHVAINSRVGEDSGATIQYGINMSQFDVENNIANCYTGAVGWWRGNSGHTYSDVISVGEYDYLRTLIVDLSAYIGNDVSFPTKQQMNSALQKYIEENNVGVPEISMKLSFVDLSKLSEYAGSKFAKPLNIGDTVHVRFDRIGVTADVRVVKTVWNVLLDRYESIEIGKERVTIADTIAGLIKKK